MADASLARGADWGIHIVLPMFDPTAHKSVKHHYRRVETALNHELKRHKITDPQQVLDLKLYAYATISVENAAFTCRDEDISRYNTAEHHPVPPPSFESVKPIHAVYEALICQYGLDKPFAKYDHRMGNSKQGMGALYRGRGFIQLTGHDNYIKYAKLAHAPEITTHPNRAGDPDIAARILAAYVLHNSQRILTALGKGDFVKARAVVNGSQHPHGVQKLERNFKLGRSLVGHPSANVKH